MSSSSLMWPGPGIALASVVVASCGEVASSQLGEGICR